MTFSIPTWLGITLIVYAAIWVILTGVFIYLLYLASIGQNRSPKEAAIYWLQGIVSSVGLGFSWPVKLIIFGLAFIINPKLPF